MSNEKKIAIAKKYVDKQLSVMREFDAAPKTISPSRYRSLIERIAETIKPPARRPRTAAR